MMLALRTQRACMARRGSPSAWQRAARRTRCRPSALASPALVQCAGMAATVIGAASALPQMVKLTRTRDASSFSTVSLCMNAASATLWLAYGYAMGLLPAVLNGLVGVLCALYVLSIKHRHKSLAATSHSSSSS